MSFSVLLPSQHLPFMQPVERLKKFGFTFISHYFLASDENISLFSLNSQWTNFYMQRELYHYDPLLPLLEIPSCRVIRWDVLGQKAGSINIMQALKEHCQVAEGMSWYSRNCNGSVFILSIGSPQLETLESFALSPPLYDMLEIEKAFQKAHLQALSLH